ncbi:peptide methionine sulfoxide reductase [Flavobacteriaceae bacterium TP-CH-4]|uniref:peptide-methionine (S)-S-oxide reductase n=1 Tax=Pelagihabitans pacificus TaxID=2696054 RepID=A0A967EAI8_9FLAO|nr:peptide-methionine (S)-S-oxide reductase [Pelagihabitans pacificus]NHF59491.1 peptide methionine sulfoxide reductase [Pelagihabitans pacificus]
MADIRNIAFGGGCHWCTEAVFHSLKGVENVKPGFVASNGKYDTFSEAVIVSYDPDEISLKELVLIHLHTHESTANHSMRTKYRSAVYTIESEDEQVLNTMWEELQGEFKRKLITEILPFKRFRPSDEQFHAYYYSNPNKPFCKRYIHPKLELLQRKFSKNVAWGEHRFSTYPEATRE